MEGCVCEQGVWWCNVLGCVVGVRLVLSVFGFMWHHVRGECWQCVETDIVCLCCVWYWGVFVRCVVSACGFMAVCIVVLWWSKLCGIVRSFWHVWSSGVVVGVGAVYRGCAKGCIVSMLCGWCVVVCFVEDGAWAVVVLCMLVSENMTCT